jgi:ABC-type transport system involved in multi-copper enzyme maturation permease subunit
VFSVFRIIVVFFTVGPWMQALIASFFYTVTVFNIYNGVQADADLRTAIEVGPPPAINIDDFDAVDSDTSLGEIHVIAQLDVNNALEYVKESKSGITKKTLIPLLEIEGSNPRPLGIVVIDQSQRQANQLLDLAVAEGSIGPIVKINGETANAFNYRMKIEDIFLSEYGYYTKDTLYVTPFFGQRETMLDGGGLAWFVAALAFGLGSIFAGLSAYKFRRNRKITSSLPPSKAARLKSAKKPAPSDAQSVVRRN